MLSKVAIKALLKDLIPWGGYVRICLLVLGFLLLVQTAGGILMVFLSGSFSFQALGRQFDEDLVKVTAGLGAIAIARLLETKK